MSDKITLVVLAAGMGSRFGGLKQMEPLGPNGETLLDYSVYDAYHAGFSKVVFVIRDFFADEFKEKIGKRVEAFMEVEYVFQDVNIEVPGVDITEREKPWGTNHAVLVCKEAVNEPFAVINSDDYYGKDGFKKVADFLKTEVSPQRYALIGYILKNTLSDSGTVNRGVCETDSADNLVAVEEVLKIKRQDDGKVIRQDKGTELDEDAIVSMNFWGFDPTYFDHLEKGFHEFVRKNKDNPTAEYYIPVLIDEMINEGEITLSVIPSHDNWYGVTYVEDADRVRAAFSKMHETGVYPETLEV
ncbi:NTP transferase domain-containing protein [Membranicola marinus]|uniref:NTP transferase domain-containing protein n=1 Tax=Membranihabitans marinus TaxID=1227546 RepID=A0A953HRD4_9BACT|nr:NTP transferase domain-containing protein [Membranihabitans marinus]MBY5956990.1 NTP transferase domain-containing protein [Membranihabitans marinus]